MASSSRCRSLGVASGLALAIAWLSCAALASGEGQGQATPPTPLDDLSLEELLKLEVITSSRTTPVAASSAPATIRVVTAEQIKNRNYTSLLDVLLDCPEVKVDSLNDPRWMNDVSMRGIWGMDKILILIDGVRVSSPTNDAIPVMENYPVHFARQIEIVFGPASALYGADAFAGVINIISKRPEDVEGTGEVTVAGGADRERTGNAYVSTRLGDVALTAAAQVHSDDQPDLAEEFPADFAARDPSLASGTFNTIYGPMTPRTPVSRDPTTPLKASGVYAGFSWRGLDVALFGNASRNPSTIANKPENAVYNRNVYFSRTVNVLSAKYSRDFGKVTSTTYLVGSWHELEPDSKWRNVYTNMEPSYQYSYGRMLKGDQLVTFKPAETWTVSGGVTYEDFLAVPDTMDLARPVSGRHGLTGIIVNSDIYPNNPDGIPARFFTLKYSNWGILAQATHTPSPELSLTLGARWDRNSRYGSSVNPRLGLVWRPSPRTSLKVLYGEAFLAPSPYASHKEFGSFVSFDEGRTFQSFFMLLSNPDLEPQHNRTFEVGLGYLVSGDLNLTVSGFFSRLKGLFAQVSDAEHGNRYGGVYPVAGHNWPIAYVETMINLGNQRNYGVTAQVDYQKRFGATGRASAYLAASWLDGSVDPDDAGPSPRVEIGGISDWMLKAGADLEWGRLTVSPRLSLLGRQRTHPQQAAAFREDDPTRRQTIPGYALLSLDVRVRLASWASAFVRGRNVLDRHYRTVNLGVAPEGLAAGSAAAEFEDGAPQNPFRAVIGVDLSF